MSRGTHLNSESGCNRRTVLQQLGGGLGGIALEHLLGNDGVFGRQKARGSAASIDGMHHPARARRVVQLFMSGAASQCDTFDYKHELIRRHGEKFDPGERVELFQSDPGACMMSPWGWRQYGQTGRWVNDCVAPLGECVDDMAFIFSMVSKSNVHGPATFLQNTGFVLPGFPSAGAWISYGLGSMTDNLPTFVVLPDPRGFAPNGPANWTAGFLPAAHQGTMIRAGRANPIFDLFPPDSARYITPASEAAGRTLLEKMNRRHSAARLEDSRLDARIASYELAARLQLSGPEVLDISSEPQYIRELYGIDARDIRVDGPMNEGEETRLIGLNCLIARRLIERGVRFVQVWSGADNGFPRRNWDSHEDLARDHWPLGRGMARAAAGLIKDLKQRGLLDDTVVVWTTEFGRMPCSQGSKGRDHNPFAFTSWLAGGGVQGGATFGNTDEWSYKAIEKPTYCYDVHATLLHLLGIDHEKLTLRHNGIDRRLTDVHGHVIHEILET
jgi:hypothetical protein